MQKTYQELIVEEPKKFDEAIQNGKLKWQKKRNPLTHLTLKKKKRKK